MQNLTVVKAPDDRISRNIVECKCINDIGILDPVPSISRNIVECKSVKNNEVCEIYTGISRNIVECKFTIVAEDSIGKTYK